MDELDAETDAYATVWSAADRIAALERGIADAAATLDVTHDQFRARLLDLLDGPGTHTDAAGGHVANLGPG